MASKSCEFGRPRRSEYYYDELLLNKHLIMLKRWFWLYVIYYMAVITIVLESRSIYVLKEATFDLQMSLQTQYEIILSVSL